MKKLFFNILPIFFTLTLIFIFYAIPLRDGKLPMPADSLLGLYHPWREVSIAGYNPGKFPVKNPLITDPILQTYPWRKLVIDNLKLGNLPLWNPYSFSGQPLLANIQSATFQISNILFLFFPFKIAWFGQILIPIILTGLFTFLFLRSQQLSNFASAFGAFTLSFSGFFVSWLTWGTIINTAMWLPLILLSLNKMFTKISPVWFLLLILSFSQTIFSGHPQTAFYVFIASFFYLIYLSIMSRRKMPLIYSLLSLLLGILISSPQLLPSMEFINFSSREIDQGYYSGREDWFLPLKNIVQIIAPDYFGNPTTYNYWGIWNWAEFVSYIGIIPLSFAIFAIFKKNTPNFFLVLGFFSILFALENPVSKIPYILNIPYLNSIQPSRIIFLFIFSLVILSSFGLEFFLKNKLKKEILLPGLAIILSLAILTIYTVIFKNNFPIDGGVNAPQVSLNNLILPGGIALTLIIILALNFLKVDKKIIGVLLFVLTIAELFRFGYKFTPFSKMEWIFPQTETLSFLQNQPRPFRVMSTDRRIFHPNTSSVYGIESVDGYDPLYLKNYAQFVSVWQSHNPHAEISSFNRIVTPQKLDSPLINLLNVRYVLTFEEIASPIFTKVYQEGITKIYENKNVIPRAFFADEVLKVDSEEEELEKLINSQIDLSKIAASQVFGYKSDQSKKDVEFEYYNDQSFGLNVKTNKNAPLIISNINYPGWTSQIDGKESEIQTVDFMFQSVIVPAGEHLVEFKYKPKSFYNGIYLSIAGIILSVGCSLYLWRRRFQS